MPTCEIRYGLAEAIKIAAMYDEKLFETLESIPPLTDRIDQIDCWGLRIACAAGLKVKIVNADERDQDLRQILNFGHTVGHAIEALSQYTIPHGEAVAMGMVAEGWLAISANIWLQPDEWRRLIALLRYVGLPTTPTFDVETLLAVMRGDKKVRRGLIHFAVPKRLGMFAVAGGRPVVPFAAERIREFLQLLPQALAVGCCARPNS